MRASSVPTLYAGCLNKRSSNFLFVALVGLCCGFCDFAVFHLRLLRLGNVFLFLNKDRSFI